MIRREKVEAAGLTKRVLAGEDAERFKESPAEMVRRVCNVFGTAKNIVVLNDEAHHCYAPAPVEDGERPLEADERSEARRTTEDARVWLSGLQAVNEKIGVRAVYDLSATPFFLRGSGYPEGTLFPWVASDFALDGRHRVGDRQGAPPAGRRRLHHRQRPHLPRPLAAGP